ncbi:16S rRNA pseudouridine(516) synthase [Crenobacter sp. SG2305]|uniref:pseudouridine synthase n=1 Tax=Crenobacter oryzisoli TaxID=3056844 RepID=UPI0025AA712A|nr:16S rRNA pseudouridine(516) synthase [Crenobacter sp. SG2305]MDN0081256.1 16S rRNA pseudouridine(516) synthase [Crenobacter sp. SG2305]
MKELYRLLHEQGFGSRKECRKLIEAGLVAIDGEPAADYRQQVDPGALGELEVDGEAWSLLELPLYLMLHKPGGYETSHRPLHNPSVFHLLPYQFEALGIAAVGRLDVDTTGLLLMSTDGQFIHALTSPKKLVPKCYRVTLKHSVVDELVARLLKGVYLKDDDEKIIAETVTVVDSYTIDMTITQGKYHQVKRMVAAASNRVMGLHRLSLGSVGLGDLAEGEWRRLSREELAALGF